MQVFRTKKELTNVLSEKPEQHSIGLVPTMGALHKGHLTLIQRAFEENKVVVVSIFVNPTQFDNKDDLKKYPKALEKDIGLIKTISKEILVFAPPVSEMYSDEISAKSYDFDGLDQVMEGAFRQGHFDGVGTIVEALLTVIAPDIAYFGEKDFQQLQIIKKLVEIRNLAVKIIGCPIVREPNGLALSSRNERLSETMRHSASLIYQTLLSAKEKFGTKSADSIIEWVENRFKQHPDFQLEYIEITDAETLRPFQKKHKNKKYRAFIAVYAEEVRLIDNIALN
ncbi:pantoate--beta-alanine ligase [Costertonia aggregata]|uniref:Pantothenate synthetase n=1 Tax=Costertonia aggregata TaxID=343403 RepID=A0A7H9AQ67_9FLAO|nr:pantoate--beta-alanine ligase [Costertonia aggregata]QLG45588.1 pantoate--beta-alanine ligase [Costertonia aggregata]